MSEKAKRPAIITTANGKWLAHNGNWTDISGYTAANVAHVVAMLNPAQIDLSPKKKPSDDETNP